MVRAAMAVLLGFAMIAAVWWLPPQGFGLLVFLVAVAGLVEFSRMFLPDAVERGAAIAGGAVVAGVMIFSRAGGDATLLVLAAVLFALAMTFMHRTAELPGVANRLGLATLGILYLGVAFPFWSWARELSEGRAIVLLAVVPACLCDTFAYLAGKSFGRRKFAPVVSPNKTWEGFAGALVGSILGTFAVKALAAPFVGWGEALVLAAIIWIVSPLGDLIESMLKRSCGVKDSGSIIPGHGGILDRLDALVFTGPAAYAVAKYLFSL